MFKYGLKLWSINENYIKEAKELYEKEFYSYIELYIVPESYENYIKLWKSLDIPFIIHATHYRHNMNLGKSDSWPKNLELTKEVQKFADQLTSEIVIYHPGINGCIEETVNQLNKIDDNRIFIENKPFIAINESFLCNGNSPEEIKFIMDNTGVKFCYDIGHGICSSNSRHVNVYTDLEKYLDLNPKMFHLTDGNFLDVYDKHYHFGKGTYDIKKILKYIPDNSSITIETYKDSTEDLEDFKKDIDYLKNLERTEY